MNLRTPCTVLLRLLCLGAVLALASCGKGESPPPASPGPAATATLNSTDPRWVSQATPRAKVAVVFIHGLTGDTLGTWAHDKDTSFFQLLKQS